MQSGPRESRGGKGGAEEPRRIAGWAIEAEAGGGGSAGRFGWTVDAAHCEASAAAMGRVSQQVAKRPSDDSEDSNAAAAVHCPVSNQGKEAKVAFDDNTFSPSADEGCHFVRDHPTVLELLLKMDHISYAEISHREEDQRSTGGDDHGASELKTREALPLGDEPIMVDDSDDSNAAEAKQRPENNLGKEVKVAIDDNASSSKAREGCHLVRDNPTVLELLWQLKEGAQNHRARTSAKNDDGGAREHRGRSPWEKQVRVDEEEHASSLIVIQHTFLHVANDDRARRRSGSHPGALHRPVWRSWAGPRHATRGQARGPGAQKFYEVLKWALGRARQARGQGARRLHEVLKWALGCWARYQQERQLRRGRLCRTLAAWRGAGCKSGRSVPAHLVGAEKCLVELEAIDGDHADGDQRLSGLVQLWLKAFAVQANEGQMARVQKLNQAVRPTSSEAVLHGAKGDSAGLPRTKKPPQGFGRGLKAPRQGRRSKR